MKNRIIIFVISGVLLTGLMGASLAQAQTLSQQSALLASVSQLTDSFTQLLASVMSILTKQSEEGTQQAATAQKAKEIVQTIQIQTEALKAIVDKNTRTGAGSVISQTAQEIGPTARQLSQTLRPGATGEEVKILQEYLVSQPDLYPEQLVTGYYGLLTERAVSNFQEKNGLEQVGIVGPKTLAIINQALADQKQDFAPGELPLKFKENVPTPSSSKTEAQKASIGPLTTQLLSLKKQYAKATAPEAKKEALDQLVSTAKKRQQALLDAAENDPQAVFLYALPKDIRDSMPSKARDYIEEEITLEGKLTVLTSDDFENKKSEYFYSLEADHDKYNLYFAGNPPEYLTGSKVRAKGMKIDKTLTLSKNDKDLVLLAAPGGGSVSKGGKKPPPYPAPPAVIPTFGGQKTLVVLINFSGSGETTNTILDVTPNNLVSHDKIDVTPQLASDLVFGSSNNSISNMFKEFSYGQAWLSGDVAGWYTMNLDNTACTRSNITSFGNSSAAASGFSLSNYNHILYVYTRRYESGVISAGLSTVGGNPSTSWTNGYLDLEVAGHELGHGLGLWHAHGLECGKAVIYSSIKTILPIPPDPPPPGTCYNYEYTDISDLMGSGNPKHFNAFAKERLGWLNYNVSPGIATVSGNGNYKIPAYELQNSESKALKILKGTNPSNGAKWYFYVEYRQPIGYDKGFDGSFTNGPLVHFGTEGYGNTSYLLDSTPESASPWWTDWRDPSLVPGLNLFDPESGISITSQSADTSGATVSVNFGTPQCVHANPTISISPLNQVGAPGQPLSYSIDVRNNDNSVCSSSNFNITANLPSGWSQNPSSSSQSLAPDASTSFSIAVASSATAIDGIVTFTETATNSSFPDKLSSASANYTVDVPIVNVLITEPKNGASLPKNSAVNLSASVIDDMGVTRVEFYVNGSLVCSASASPYTCQWKTPAKAGTFSIAAKAYDAAGNVGISPSIQVATSR